MNAIEGNGRHDILLPPGNKIAISCENCTGTISYSTFPLSPDIFYEHTRITDSALVIGPFDSEKKIRLDAQGNGLLLYKIGADPIIVTRYDDKIGIGKIPPEKELDIDGDATVDEVLTVSSLTPSQLVGSGLDSELTSIGIGAGLSLSMGVLSSTGSGGTITSFGFTNGNGFTGVVTNPTTTPNLSLSISDTRITSSLLTGYSIGADTAITVLDTLLSALGKIQGQITARPNLSVSGQDYLSINTNTQVLTANSINLSGTNVTSILPISNGGNNTGSQQSSGILWNNGTANTSVSNLVYNGTGLVSLQTGTFSGDTTLLLNNQTSGTVHASSLVIRRGEQSTGSAYVEYFTFGTPTRRFRTGLLANDELFYINSISTTCLTITNAGVLNFPNLTASKLMVTNSSKDLVSGDLSGDVSSSGLSTTLATVNANVGLWGNATQAPVLTVNAKGLITSISNATISGVPPGGAAGGDLSGTYPNPNVARINGATLGTTTATNGNILIGNSSSWVSTAVIGDVTLDLTGLTTIGTNKVTDTIIRQSAGASVIGRSANFSGNVTDIIAGSDGLFLGRLSGSVGFSTVPASSISSGAILSKVDDTNVTLSLTGSPSAALLQSVVLTLGWTGQLGPTRGGTGTGTYTLGDILYSSASNTLAKLTGNITTAKQYLSQTGNGSNSAAPAWATIVGSDITGTALTKSDDTNVTLTLGGSPTTSLLRAASLTLGWTGQLAASRGGIGLDSSAWTQGDIPYISAIGTWNHLAKNTTATRYLANTGSSNNPAWAQVDMTNGITGIAPIANGGSNASTGDFYSNAGAQNGVIYYNATRLTSSSDFDYDPTQGILDITSTSANPGLSVKTTVTGSSNVSFLTVARGDTANGSSQLRFQVTSTNEWYLATFSGSQNLVLSRNNNATTILTMNYTDNSVSVNNGNLILSSLTKTIQFSGTAVSAGTANGTVMTGAVLVAGTVTINNSLVDSTWGGFASATTNGGTTGAYRVSCASGTVTVKSSNVLDTSTVTVVLFKIN